MDVRPVQREIETAARFFASMGNAHRLMILCELIAGERCVGELAGTIRVSQSALSQHLAKLRRAGVVRCRRASRSIIYSLEDRTAEQVIACMAKAIHRKALSKRRKSKTGDSRNRLSLPTKRKRRNDYVC